MTVATSKPAPGPEANLQLADRSSSQTQVQAEAAQIAQNKAQGQLENLQDLPVQGRSADADVVKAKDLAAAQGAAAEPSSPTAPPRASAAKAMHASTRWAISSSGALQRSFDAGETWEGVNISPAFFPGSMLPGSMAMKSTVENRAEYDAKKSKKNEKAQPAAILVFRAVAAIDAEVWAGGSGAMLYHSADSGTNWIRVLPAEATTALTGDIIGIEFFDSQSGRVATSTGEAWTTADGGRAWHKQ
jgi:photosystem II stability/assembly factor-like uncharacterized protein